MLVLAVVIFKKKILMYGFFLLIFFIKNSFGMFIFAQEPDESGPVLDVYAEVLGDTFEQKVPFAVTIMVRHPNPAEVRVQPPDFDENFSLERMITEVRLIKNEENDMERWTSVEFLLLPSNSGALSIGSFEVAIPGRTAATKRIAINITPGKNYQPQLRWVGRDAWSTPPEHITIGKYGYAALRLSGWDRGKTASELPLRIDATENAIIDTIPVPEPERAKGIVLLLQILPLEEKTINIASHTFRHEGRTLEVPSLTIKVLPNRDLITGVYKNAQLHTEENVDVQELINAKPQEKPFPFIKKVKLNGIIRIAYEQKIEKAKELWKDGNCAAAIAELRQGERDLLSGYLIADVRKSAEDSIFSSPVLLRQNEKWRPRSLLIILTCFFGAALTGAVVLLIFRMSKHQQKKETSNFILYSLICLFIISFGTSGSFLISSINIVGKKGVLEKSYLQTIPEAGLKTDQILEEGQTVNIRSEANGWTYIESTNGKAGWVISSNVHSY